MVRIDLKISFVNDSGGMHRACKDSSRDQQI